MTKKVTEKTDRYPIEFLLMYAIFFGGSATFGPYIPLYLKEIGLNQTLIGTFFAIGPLIAMLSQPIWGIIGDRSKSKNIVLLILFGGSICSMLLFPASTAMWYVFCIYGVFTFFQASINPLIDTITLEQLETSKWKFGPIRMGGVYGYSIMAIVAGLVLKNNLSLMFFMYAAILTICFAMVFKLPVVKGHQHGDKKVSPWVLFKDKKLVLLLSFSLVIQSTLGYYYSFFPLYFEQLGGDSSLLGWAMSIASIEPTDDFKADTIEDYVKLGSRVVTPLPESISEDSLMGMFGCAGDVANVPPKAATIGLRDVANARYHLELQYRGPLGMTTSWQRQISRLMLYGPVTMAVPASILRLYKGICYVSEDIAKPIELPPNKNPLE
jgi:predicted MFS family arabinose efflux permease